LPHLIGQGMTRELAYTGRQVDAREAETLGLVNRLFASNAALTVAVHELAQAIAAKSPLATRGLKEVMNYSRDHSVADSLNHVATWNAALLLSADLDEGIAAQREQRPPRFID
ncbi:MAG TPA: enoyl-CoA hydratase-related protein, partial [Azonexus sp.]|nr:enoyl-CoA hydratase-related protein [Azonexus sp.]